jgi:hypothetical protein
MKLFGDRDRNEPDLNAELESHLQMSAGDHESRGTDAKSAAERARRELGNIPLIQQTTVPSPRSSTISSRTSASPSAPCGRIPASPQSLS